MYIFFIKAVVVRFESGVRKKEAGLHMGFDQDKSIILII